MTAKEPRPLSRCANCAGAYRDHVGSAYTCAAFVPKPRKATLRRSMSFSQNAVDALQDLLFAVHHRDTRKALAVTVAREPALTAVLSRLKR